MTSYLEVEPIEETERRIQQTTIYIVDAERLAPGGVTPTH